MTPGSKDDPSNYLPDGFLERTKDVGRAVPSWAPQVRVLAHAATGGFFSHCGWNSTLESAVHGVPMIAHPLYAEQYTNAVLLTEVVGIAIRPRAREPYGIVGRMRSAAAKELMQGRGARRCAVVPRSCRRRRRGARAAGGVLIQGAAGSCQ
uniref:Uncharacterized protein n=1 Tax=Ananas comosus var. bracteatus TaxID=296719 RepID=A0A6V7NZQ5_ANACO|nr:unnamed protein product [Ananas comosus var. bracteatus]